MDAEATGQGCSHCERLRGQVGALPKGVAELTARMEKLSAALEET